MNESSGDRRVTMTCYKDTTWCMDSLRCGNVSCGRRLTTLDLETAKKNKLEIARAHFRESEHCPGFEKLKDDNG